MFGAYVVGLVKSITYDKNINKHKPASSGASNDKQDHLNHWAAVILLIASRFPHGPFVVRDTLS